MLTEFRGNLPKNAMCRVLSYIQCCHFTQEVLRSPTPLIILFYYFLIRGDRNEKLDGNYCNYLSKLLPEHYAHDWRCPGAPLRRRTALTLTLDPLLFHFHCPLPTSARLIQLHHRAVALPVPSYPAPLRMRNHSHNNKPAPLMTNCCLRRVLGGV